MSQIDFSKYGLKEDSSTGPDFSKYGLTVANNKSDFSAQQANIPNVNPDQGYASQIYSLLSNLFGYSDKQKQQFSQMMKSGNVLPHVTNDQVQAGIEIGLTPELKAPEWLLNYASRFAPKAGKPIANWATSVGTNAGVGAAMSDDKVKGAEIGGGISAVSQPLIAGLTSKNPYLRALTGASLAGGAEYAFTNSPTKTSEGAAAGVGALLPLLLGKKGGFNQAAAYKAFNDLSPEQVDSMLKRKQAGESLGVQLTPAEASGDPVLGRQQGNLGSTPKSARTMFQFGESRQQAETDAINQLLDSISAPGAKETVEYPLYKEAQKDTVSENELAKLLVKDSRLQKTFNKVAKDVDYKTELANVPSNSIQYIDRVKQALDDAYSSSKKSGENSRARLIDKSRKDLISLADASSPKYAQARAVAQKRITREELERGLLNSEKSGSNFYDKFLKNDDSYHNYYRKLADKESPDQESIAQMKLRAMKESFPYLINPVNAKVTGSLASSGLEKNHGPKSMITSLLNNLVAGHYHESLSKLFTSSDWDAEIKKIADMKDSKSKGMAMSSLLARVGAMQGNK